MYEIQALVENGLSQKEAALYLAILAAGEATFSQIAGKTRIKRTSIYHLVDGMKEKGLVSLNKRRGIQYVSALPPRILIERFKKSADLAEKMLPGLLEMAYVSPLKPKLQFFEGVSGIREILREFSYSSVPAMGFTDYERMPPELFKFIRKEIIPERKRHHNRAQLIVPKNPTNEKIQSEDAQYFSEHRLVEFPVRRYSMELLLFGESKIAFLSFEKTESFGVIIDSRTMYQTLKNIFLFIWSPRPDLHR